MKPVRLGIIGLGNIGNLHAEYLLAGKVQNCVLTAVSTRSSEKLATFQQRGLKTFADGMDLIRSGEIDAVLIATPHFQHPAMGIAAFEAGLHVLVEKPIAAHKADAERLIAAHKKHPHLVFGAMFQLRAESRYREIKKIITDGRLGSIVRLSWIVTEWFRTDAYYASNAWRGTWKGEGGGVLINQCLHQLDMLQWLLGMPARIRSFVALGRFHKIEVEDDVTAYLEFPNGATGTFISTTGEAPGTNRLEISGDKAKILLEYDRALLFQNETSAVELCASAKLGFQKPEIKKSDIPLIPENPQHATITQNFVNAILSGTELIAPGAEGIQSIELANAMLYSGLIGQTVELPLDGAAYEKKLNELIAASKFEKKVVKTSSEDFSKSFVR
jgi:predicted dehydrogenase